MIVFVGRSVGVICSCANRTRDRGSVTGDATPISCPVSQVYQVRPATVAWISWIIGAG